MTGDPRSFNVPGWLAAARDHWTNRGGARPAFAIEPGPDQESVWDYPRPPAVVADERTVEVHGPAGLVARSTAAVRVLETSHPPSWYVPPSAIVDNALVVCSGSSHCEWKGAAEYLALAKDPDQPVGWRYPNPYPEFADQAGWVSFYPDRVQCRVDGEIATAQAGGFYGGWVTSELVGPFKGEPGTSGW